jgi:hypothetical protein
MMLRSKIKRQYLAKCILLLLGSLFYVVTGMAQSMPLTIQLANDMFSDCLVIVSSSNSPNMLHDNHVIKTHYGFILKARTISFSKVDKHGMHSRFVVERPSYDPPSVDLYLNCNRSGRFRLSITQEASKANRVDRFINNYVPFLPQSRTLGDAKFVRHNLNAWASMIELKNNYDKANNLIQFTLNGGSLVK